MRSSWHLFSCAGLACCLAAAAPARAADLPSYGGPGQGPVFRLECPPGMQLGGLRGQAGPPLSGLGIECRPDPAGGASAPEAAVQRRTCPAPATVYAVNFLFSPGAAPHLEAVRMRCAPPDGSGPALAELVFPAPAQAGLGATPLAYAGSGWQACPPGEVAAGIHGAGQRQVDSIGLVCRPAATRAAPVPAAAAPDAWRSPFAR